MNIFQSYDDKSRLRRCKVGSVLVTRIFSARELLHTKLSIKIPEK